MFVDVKKMRRAANLSALPALLALCACGGDHPAAAPAAALAAVSVSQAVDRVTASVGDRITWTMMASNQGPGATSGTVTLLASVPANLGGLQVTSMATLASSVSASGVDAPACAACGTSTVVAVPIVASTARRPQFDAATAAGLSPLRYLAQGGKSLPSAALAVDNWDPTAGVGDVATFTPQFTIDAAGKSDASNFVTVQAAMDAAVALGSKAAPVYIRIKPGTYRETVCLPATGAPAIRLYSLDSDASHTVIVFNNANPTIDPSRTLGNTCGGSPASPVGTSGSATVAVSATDFQAKNLTIANDYVKGSFAGSNQSAVALMTQGDRIVLENVRLLGHQDTFYMKSANVDQVARVYVKNSYIEGDVDFIFGRATAVLDNCTIHSLNTGKGTGFVTAASTDYRNSYGFLITNSRLTAETGTPAGQIYLGRAWDEGVGSLAVYGATSPNGQVLIRNSVLGAHIRKLDPWADSTATRPYSSAPSGALPANRLFEYGNTGPGNGQ